MCTLSSLRGWCGRCCVCRDMFIYMYIYTLKELLEVMNAMKNAFNYTGPPTGGDNLIKTFVWTVWIAVLYATHSRCTFCLLSWSLSMEQRGRLWFVCANYSALLNITWSDALVGVGSKVETRSPVEGPYTSKIDILLPWHELLSLWKPLTETFEQ